MPSRSRAGIICRQSDIAIEVDAITFDQINEGMETLASGEACKIIIRPDRKVSLAPSSDGRKREIDPDTRGTIVHR